jgi:hypothetical protein
MIEKARSFGQLIEEIRKAEWSFETSEVVVEIAKRAWILGREQLREEMTEQQIRQRLDDHYRMRGL